MSHLGIICALVTPLNNDGSINEIVTSQLIEHQINLEVDGLFILGSNGEFHVLSNTQKLEFARVVVKCNNKRVKIYAGVGSNSTNEVINMSLRMKEIGVDALSIITPYFIKLTQEELIYHYVEISNKIDIPIILYNIPSYTNNNLEPSTVKRLSKIANIIGIKDSSGDIEQMKKYIDLTENNNFSILSGSDSLILKSLKMGAHGAVSALCNIIGENIVAIYKMYAVGNMIKAEEYQKSIEDIRNILKISSIPSSLKYALIIKGFDVGKALMPVLPLSYDNKEAIRKVVLKYQSGYNYEKI